MHTPTHEFLSKKIYDIEVFGNWLKEQGYPLLGVYRKGAGVCVCGEGGAPDPTALVQAYINPNYYEFTCPSGVPGGAGPGVPAYPVIVVPVGADVTFHIRKIRGLDGAVMPDNDTLDFHWHLPAVDQPKTVTLVNGEQDVVVHAIKRCWGFAEAVPTGAADIKSKAPSLVRGGVILWAK